ncbi:MAG TPA: hypothetical protein VGK59_17170, partial [Ohtaekwangia sp.]
FKDKEHKFDLFVPVLNDKSFTLIKIDLQSRLQHSKEMLTVHKQDLIGGVNDKGAQVGYVKSQYAIGTSFQ